MLAHASRYFRTGPMAIRITVHWRKGDRGGADVIVRTEHCRRWHRLHDLVHHFPPRSDFNGTAGPVLELISCPVFRVISMTSRSTLGKSGDTMLRIVFAVGISGLVFAGGAGTAQAAPILPLPAAATAGTDNMTDVQWARRCWRDRWGRLRCASGWGPGWGAWGAAPGWGGPGWGGGWGRNCWRDRWGRVRCTW